MKSFFAIAVIVACLAVTIQAATFGGACSHSGVQNQDDSQCSGVNNNMLCGTGNKCVCADTYGLSGKFTPKADGTGCSPA